jgi:hypothetical protein
VDAEGADRVAGRGAVLRRHRARAASRRSGSWRGCAENYDEAVCSGALPPLIEIGRDIAESLDGGDRWLKRVLGGTGEITLDIAVPGRPEEREPILLDVP